MKKQIILADKQHVTTWSGGQTRELFITGGAASYAARDFTLRLSSATVETERSVFTDLPGFQRALMPLHGTIRLTHNDGPARTLVPFAADRFAGSDKTVSEGKCRDFNVMWQEQAYQEMQMEALLAFPVLQQSTAEDFYYAYQGSFLVQAADEKFLLPAGALLHLQAAGDVSFSPQMTQMKEKASLIHVTAVPAGPAQEVQEVPEVQERRCRT